MLTIDSVVTAVEQYHPQADTGLIRQAYEFAADAHRHQKRKSGIPYISHPLEVASILTELQMDAMTVASALLHDTIEDTDAGEEQIASLFSPEVAALVSGVTKLSKLEFFSQEERQAESFRKMLVAMAKDIRVILVKLADRLHNLRTLEHMAGPQATPRRPRDPGNLRPAGPPPGHYLDDGGVGRPFLSIPLSTSVPGNRSPVCRRRARPGTLPRPGPGDRSGPNLGK